MLPVILWPMFNKRSFFLILRTMKVGGRPRRITGCKVICDVPPPFGGMRVSSRRCCPTIQWLRAGGTRRTAVPLCKSWAVGTEGEEVLLGTVGNNTPELWVVLCLHTNKCAGLYQAIYESLSASVASGLWGLPRAVAQILSDQASTCRADRGLPWLCRNVGWWL